MHAIVAISELGVCHLFEKRREGTNGASKYERSEQCRGRQVRTIRSFKVRRHQNGNGGEIDQVFAIPVVQVVMDTTLHSVFICLVPRTIHASRLIDGIHLFHHVRAAGNVNRLRQIISDSVVRPAPPGGVVLLRRKCLLEVHRVLI